MRKKEDLQRPRRQEEARAANSRARPGGDCNAITKNDLVKAGVCLGRYIWRVETTAIDIPREVLRRSMPGFGREPSVIWTRQRKIAEQISNADERPGGQGGPMPFPRNLDSIPL